VEGKLDKEMEKRNAENVSQEEEYIKELKMVKKIKE
jgi:hypothetical protein